jgi:hypothetical protein
MIMPDPARGAAPGIVDADRPDVVNCPVCPHPMAAHDANRRAVLPRHDREGAGARMRLLRAVIRA